ncbi:MAG: type II/IV secretion system protein, partial [Planctomycetota bacterium]
YPPLPRGFARGNYIPDPESRQLPQIGFYLSLPKFALLLASVLGWAWTMWWVDADSRALKIENATWNSVVFAVPFGGFVTALCMPHFGLLLLVLVPAQAVPLWLYIRERNARVPDSAKVLTRAHLHRVLVRTLARLGIDIGRGKGTGTLSGPDIRFIGKQDSKLDPDRSRQVESSRGFMAAKELVYDAILRRCTDIHLEPADRLMNVRMRIDGVMYPVEPFERSLGDSVINIFKVLAAMDITEKRRPQDGSFRAICEGREIDFRVATQGTRMGQKLSLRILDQSQSVSRLDDLGLRKQLKEQLEAIVQQPHGLLLVCGPTGAGKSTTLYACINALDIYQYNIITIEDPIEYKIDGVTQIEINTRSGQTFAASLRSVLRQDPDVVMVGEIRDPETARIACQAANTGHMVFSTVHANDAITAVYRMLDLDVEPYMLSSSLSGILAQRLVRRLCPVCRVPYKPDPQFLRQVNLPAHKVRRLFHPPETPNHACPSCGGLGYRGRIGVFELLNVNDRIRDLIREKAGVTVLKAEARKNGMLYMYEEGLRLVVRGITSLEELRRVVKPTQ